MDVIIRVESPLQADVRALIAALNENLLSLTPPEHCFHMTVEEMAGPETTVFVARHGGSAIACGALRRHADLAEVKRMYTVPEYQGRGVGGKILCEIVALARKEGFTRIVLETGDRHPAAWRVYERAGFKRCGPVLDYPDTKWSVFYDLELPAQAG